MYLTHVKAIPEKIRFLINDNINIKFNRCSIKQDTKRK